MAKDANINIRIEKEVKSNAEALFASFGITVSDAIKIFLHPVSYTHLDVYKRQRVPIEHQRPVPAPHIDRTAVMTRMVIIEQRRPVEIHRRRRI